MDEKISEINRALSGQLLIGNHELLDIYGNDAQNKLREVSKNISSILLYGNDELEENINQVMDCLNEIDDIELKDKSNGIGVQEKLSKNFRKKYQDILHYIDNLTLLLQLQQARLLKDNVVMDNYAKQVCECESELSGYIEYANKVYCQTVEEIKKENTGDTDDIQNWASRLQKRIEALETSHVVALQSEQELSMLQENNRLLLDKISDAISNAIPLWQMQVTISLGLEESENNQRLQNEIMHKTDSYLKQSRKKIKRHEKRSDASVDLEEMITNNKKLQEILDDLSKIEAKDNSIKETIIKLQ